MIHIQSLNAWFKKALMHYCAKNSNDTNTEAFVSLKSIHAPLPDSFPCLSPAYIAFRLPVNMFFTFMFVWLKF